MVALVEFPELLLGQPADDGFEVRGRRRRGAARAAKAEGFQSSGEAGRGFSGMEDGGGWRRRGGGVGRECVAWPLVSGLGRLWLCCRGFCQRCARARARDDVVGPSGAVEVEGRLQLEEVAWGFGKDQLVGSVGGVDVDVDADVVGSAPISGARRRDDIAMATARRSGSRECGHLFRALPPEWSNPDGTSVVLDTWLEVAFRLCGRMGHLSLACRSVSKKKKACAVVRLAQALRPELDGDGESAAGGHWDSTLEAHRAHFSVLRLAVVGCRHGAGDMLEGFWLRGRVCDWRENLARAERCRSLLRVGGGARDGMGWDMDGPLSALWGFVDRQWLGLASRGPNWMMMSRQDECKRKKLEQRHERAREGTLI